jgi:hypothetical protein
MRVRNIAGHYAAGEGEGESGTSQAGFWRCGNDKKGVDDGDGSLMTRQGVGILRSFLSEGRSCNTLFRPRGGIHND